MNVKDKNILEHLIKIYKDFYCSSDIFRKEYFKYSIEEVEEAIKKIISNTEQNTIYKTSIIRDEIKLIANEEMARQFYLENLTYNKDEAGAKEKCLKNISLEELKLIYTILYSTTAKSKVTKNELLSLIEKYFNGIDRALSMKP